jgi:hypothetical protein
MVDHIRIKIVYTIIIIICIYFLLIGYFKLKYPFWSRQPIFHFHNLLYWVKPPGIINENLPEKTKFYDEQIEIFDTNTISTEKKELFCNFIKKYFNRNYLANTSQILDNFKAHNDKSFISFKKYNNDVLSCVTTRPLECYLDGNKMIINYYDFLCIHDKHKNKHYSAMQIYTHNYHLRNKCNNIVSFFKFENENNLVVPLTRYSNYIFKIDNWKMCYNFDQPNINIVFINKSNMNKFYQIFFNSKKTFDCFITYNLSHIFHLIEKEHLKVTVLMINNVFKAFFVFKNTYYKKNNTFNENIIECCSSYKDDKVNNELFTLGFMISLSLISKDLCSKILLVNNVSNNNIILKLLLEKYKYIDKSVISLCFYNFGYYPKESKDIFCII